MAEIYFFGSEFVRGNDKSVDLIPLGSDVDLASLKEMAHAHNAALEPVESEDAARRFARMWEELATFKMMMGTTILTWFRRNTWSRQSKHTSHSVERCAPRSARRP